MTRPDVTSFPRTTTSLPPQTVLSLRVLLTVGVLLLVGGGIGAPGRLWASLLLLGYYVFGVGVGALYFLTTHHAAGGGWATAFKRVPEAMLPLVPVGGVLIAAALFGDMLQGAFNTEATRLYSWMSPAQSHHGEPLVHSFKDAWLQPTFFYARAVIVLAVVSFFARALRLRSLDQDVDGSTEHTVAARRISIAFLVVGSVLLSIASIDWFMSLEPAWYSTMYIVHHFAGNFVTGLAVITLVLLALRSRGALPGFTVHHLHDLGKLLFAMSTFWMYIWFSQFMLIWYTNIPEETIYFSRRLGEGRTLFLVALPILMWVVPFFSLLSQRAKRSPAVVGRICVVLLLGHWLDLFQMTVGQGESGRFALPEIGSGLAAVGLIFLISTNRLTRVPLVPEFDPYLEESLHHHV